MSAVTRILQISDCHLSADPKTAYRGINAHGNLQAVLQDAEAFAPQIILASGDLSEDASPASYRALQNYFEALEIPVLALPGNHDDAGLLASTFPGSPVAEAVVSEHAGWQIIRLNSCVPHRPEGHLGRQMLAGLEQVLAGDTGKPRLIALHHQPVAVGSGWIDCYPLRNPAEFLALIDRSPDVKVVLWGHVHQAFEAHRRGTGMLGGPSSAINSLPGARNFTPDPGGPACRWLKLTPDGHVLSGII